MLTDGPFLESKEIIGGYIIVLAKDYDEAVQFAKECPLLDHCQLEVRNLQLAEDMVQETLLQAFNQWTFGSIPENPSAWVMTVAKRKVLNHLKRKELKDNPVIGLNRAVILSQTQGPLPAIRKLNELRAHLRLQGYYLLHATLGELYARSGEMGLALSP